MEMTLGKAELWSVSHEQHPGTIPAHITPGALPVYSTPASTVHSSIQTPSFFSHFLMLQPNGKLIEIQFHHQFEVEGTACRAQRQDCVVAQIWGRLQNKFCCIEGSQEQRGRILEKPGLFLELAIKPN